MAGKPWWECEMAGHTESIQGSPEKEMISFLLLCLKFSLGSQCTERVHCIVLQHGHMDSVDSWAVFSTQLDLIPL